MENELELEFIVDSKIFLKHFKKKYSTIYKNKQSGLKKMLVVKPIESERNFYNALLEIGIHDKDAEKLYLHLNTLLEQKLNKLTRSYLLIIFYLLSTIIFTWVWVSYYLYPHELIDFDSKLLFFDSSVDIHGTYYQYLFIYFASIITFIALLIQILGVLTIKGMDINSRTGNFLQTFSLLAFLAIYIIALPLYIYTSNLDTVEKVETYLKDTPVKQVPVIISEVDHYIGKYGYFEINIKNINQDDMIPLSYFSLDDYGRDAKNFKKGDTLNFVISKELSNIFELRHSNGKSVLDRKYDWE